MNGRFTLLHAVSDFAFGENTGDETRAVALDRRADAADVGGVQSQADDVVRHGFTMMLPKPNDGFVWVQAAAGPALVCSALRPFADHLFTTRLWALGSALGPAPESAWEEVARALAVDPAHLIRAHQVHGASVVVRRASRDAPSPATPADLPDADILVSDDARLAL